MAALGILQLKDNLDGYHQRRADKHGRLYILMRRNGVYQDMYEAKSVATGALYTLDKAYVEEAPDGEEAA